MYCVRPKNTFHFQEDPFIKWPQCLTFIMQKKILSKKLLQTKPQIKYKVINFKDL